MTKNGFLSSNYRTLVPPTNMSQTCEDYPLWMDSYDAEDWMEKTPEIHPSLLEAVEHAIEAEVDILDWAAETNPEHDPENYTCWSYDEYKNYMRERFSYIPSGFWKWFDIDEMILHFWRENKYDLVYLESENPILIGDTWRTAGPPWDVNKWFKNEPDKFYILQYGKPPIHPLE